MERLMRRHFLLTFTVKIKSLHPEMAALLGFYIMKIWITEGVVIFPGMEKLSVINTDYISFVNKCNKTRLL